MRAPGLVVAVAFAAACGNEMAAPSMSEAPTIGIPLVRPNANNALSAILSVRVRNVDSVAVRFRLADNSSGIDSLTPAVHPLRDSAVIPVLGLLPSRLYTMTAVGYASNGILVGSAIQFMTDTLPADLPRYSASGQDPSPGYVIFAAGMYGVVIDNTGRVVWYRRFANGPGLTFMAQPTGHYVARPPTADSKEIASWIEIDPVGNISRTFGCALGLQPRFHDVISEFDGGNWIMCDETRTMDLSSVGGAKVAIVTGTAVQHISAAGALLFHWSAFDHLSITDLDPADRAGPNVNWTHGNAIDLDADGNLLVSFRSLGEITKINSASGAVIWRMGGRRNQFIFPDSPAPAFVRQHGIRLASRGVLILLDNLGDPNDSQAERYSIDEKTRTARLTQSYGATPAVVTQIGGSVQALPGGRTLVSFGTTGRVEEFDSAGKVLWRIDGDAGYVFHAQRIRSLYAPGVGTSR